MPCETNTEHTMTASTHAASLALGEDGRILFGKGERLQGISLRFANRHGLIAGATGTGKTVTLQVLAEGFSRAGVPVFMADVKGDLAGLSQAGTPHPRVDERVKAVGITDFAFAASPVVLWDIFGQKGHPLRATISEMGPLLLSRLLGLSDAQEGVLHVAFAVADDEGMLLLDLKDLRAILEYVAEHAQALGGRYGLVSKASAHAIQRDLLKLEQQGAEAFFGEPALDIRDLMRIDRRGKGYINILAADRLMQSPGLYSTFLLWLLSELFESLPEKGDADRPELVFFFDEAHLLFDEAPKALLDKVEQVVRLIRSKGVGVYFITQNPQDVPDAILGQLGNRIQHALRAFTPRDQKAVKAAAETFRANPALNTEEAITQLGVGEALVSTLDANGAPGMVERTLICPPVSRIGSVSEQERAAVMADSPVRNLYDTAADRDSAYEMLARRAEEEQRNAPPQQEATSREARQPRAPRQQRAEEGLGEFGKDVLRSAAKSATRIAARRLAYGLVRGVLGSLRR